MATSINGPLGSVSIEAWRTEKGRRKEEGGKEVRRREGRREEGWEGRREGGERA